MYPVFLFAHNKRVRKNERVLSIGSLINLFIILRVSFEHALRNNCGGMHNSGNLRPQVSLFSLKEEGIGDNFTLEISSKVNFSVSSGLHI